MGHDYTRLIADAAKDFVRAEAENHQQGTQVTRLEKERAHERLCWLIEAEKYQRDPGSYRPSS